MSKRVEKISIEPNSKNPGAAKVEIYFDKGHLPDIQVFFMWSEIPIFLEERFYAREGKTFYVPKEA